MRVPSRRLPPLPVQPPSAAVRWGCLLFAAACVGVPAWTHPLGTAIFLAVVLPVGWLLTVMDRRQRRRLVARLRAGDPLCRFARDFDCRATDTWLIRAVFEEVQDAYRGVSAGPVPVRAADRWLEDLRIDGDELDDIGGHVARRAGYGLEETRQNPLYGRVQTVGDLVAFLRGQPCRR